MNSKMILFCLCLLTSGLYAQEKEGKFVPDFVTIQYAGSIGFINAGAGYSIFRGRAITSFHYGVVPATKGGELHIVAGKLLFNTMRFKLSERVMLDPLDAGIMISYHFGSPFASSWPDHRYPEGYYWWKTSVRAHLNTQSSITVRLKDKAIHSLSVYADYNISELYLVSIFQNRRSLRPGEVIKAGFGIRATF